MTSITQYRKAYKPFEFPQFQKIFELATLSHWVKQEVKMESDFRDWQLTKPAEKRVIGGTLKAFTIGETHISDYWADVITKQFPKHEIVSMARWFSANERIHADAYSHLEATLGIEDYEAFLGDPVVKEKLSLFTSSFEPQAALGIFSGAIEGVSLFGSFAVLLHFSRNARFRGLRQIISWSILDEQLHSDAAAMLFNIYSEELGGVKPSVEDEIIGGFRLVLQNEEACLQQSFGGESIEGLDYDSVVEFLKARANNRLVNMNLFPVFDFDKEKAYSVKEWFDPLAGGLVNQDFFASVKEGSGYTSTPDQQFNINILKELNLSYA